MTRDSFRQGDLVEVKRPAEILATLDERGALDSVPFMPEMVKFCGRRFLVTSRTDKVCTLLWGGLGSRRLAETVLLEDLRCDGGGHDGCQSNCRLFWKEAWLRPARADSPSATGPEDADACRRLAELAASNTRDHGGAVTENQTFRCQASELCAASTPLRTADPRPYLRELASGDVAPRRFARVMTRAASWHIRSRLGRQSHRFLRGSATPASPSEALDLQPGDWVQVKSREEIAATLTDQSTNRGLFFDIQMLNYSGKILRVERRVTRIINPDNRRMIRLKRDCVVLEDVACTGNYSFSRWFCPRADQPFWRECWLRRVEPPVAQDS